MSSIIRGSDNIDSSDIANKSVDIMQSLMPIGAIITGYTVLPRTIVGFGGLFNRADYPRLWEYLVANPGLVETDTTWNTNNNANGMNGKFSSGNGTTTFRVPNLDKAFLRNDSRGVTTYQLDDFKSHSHTGQYPNMSGTGYSHLNGNGAWNFYTMSDIGWTGGAETRPKNIAVLPLVVAY